MILLGEGCESSLIATTTVATTIPAAAAAAAAAAATTTTTNADSTCVYCVELSDKDCLATLEVLYDAISDKNRLAFLRSAFPDYDTRLSEKEVTFLRRPFWHLPHHPGSLRRIAALNPNLPPH